MEAQSKRTKTRFTGVYVRSDATRRHRGKPDLVYDITWKDAHGRKHWEKAGRASEGYTAALASQLRSDRLVAVREHGQVVRPSKRDPEPSLGEAWRNYRDSLEAQGRDMHREDSRWKKHVARYARLSLSQVSTERLEELMKAMFEDGQSPASIRNALGLIRATLGSAKRRGWKGANPFDDFTLPRLNNRRVRFLSPEEADALLSAVSSRSIIWGRICRLALSSGMRASEIFALRWSDVDIGNGLIRVRQAKAGQARTVWLNESAAAVLREHGGEQAEKPSEAHVFEARRGGGRIREVSSTFGRAVDELGLNVGRDRLDHVVFHTLRHTFASWLVQSGVPIYTVAELMGHSTIQMTKRYAHLAPAQHQDATSRIDQMFTHRGSSQEERSDTNARPLVGTTRVRGA